MGANFITGTGTDIGKTWLACALLRHWRAEGRRVAALKPVLSGFDPAHAATSDAGALLAALGREASMVELDAIAPWRFAAALSPDMAATLEGRRIDFEQLVGFTRRAANADSCPTLVEGVGGVMAPLDDTHTVRDWIVAGGVTTVDAWVPPDTFVRVEAAAASSEDLRLKPIFEALGGDVPYDQIRVVLAVLKVRGGHPAN